jgi:molecular chaperone GrpE
MVGPMHDNGGAGRPEREVRDSGGAPAPSAAAQVASDAGAPPEPRADEGPDHAFEPEPEPEPSADGKPEPDAVSAREPDAVSAREPERDAVSAREPEAPVGPTGLTPEYPQLVEIDLEELTARAGKADEYLELAQRTKADFENYRKRAIREAAAARDRGMAKLALELLPAVDNLDRALEAADAAASDGIGDADNGGSPLVSGIRLVHADVIAALARVGIEPFSPVGERFDPQHHEAIAQQPVDGAESGTVVEVYQRGYRFGDTVLRPARVVVAA